MEKIKLDNGQYVLIDDSQFKRLNKFNWSYNSKLQKPTKQTIKNNFYELDKYLLRFYDSYNTLNTNNIIINHIDNNILNNQLSNINIYDIKAISKRIIQKFFFVKEYIDKVINLFNILNYKFIALTKEDIENQCIYIEYEYKEFIFYYNILLNMNYNIFTFSNINKNLIHKLFTYKFVLKNTLATYNIRQKIQYNDKLKNILYELLQLKLYYSNQYINIINHLNENDFKNIISYLQ